jgi:beta-lactamase regulating signal transducer with metallopeptidase domain
MIAAWMIYASLLGALVGLAALAADRAARACQLSWLPSRLPWTVSLLATFILPLALAARALTLTVPNAPPITRAPVTIVARGPALSLDVVSSLNASNQQAAPTGVVSSLSRALAVPVRSTPALDRVLLALWLTGMLVALAIVVRSSVTLARRRRSWSRQVLLGVPVLVAPEFGPALAGTIRPEIVVPEWALASDPSSLELMLRHEAEHRRAHDTLLLAACSVAAVICPWNASLWWQLARLRLAVEIDCDARVLARHGDAHTYAKVLVDAGERMMTTTMLARAFSGRRSLLERRILAMSAARAPRRLFPAFGFAAAAALCVAIACSARAPDVAAQAAAPIPTSLSQTNIAPQQYFPRLQRIDTVDAAGVAWLRGEIARYYPSVLAGDTSRAFITFYVNADGRVVGAAARLHADIGADTSDAGLMIYDFPPFNFGANAPASDRARVAAERATFKADEDTMFKSMNPSRSVLGARVVLPREFAYDTSRGRSPYDPFLGADPHAFQREDQVFLTPEMFPPNGISIRVLTLRPGRGGPADFGHRVLLAKTPFAPKSSPSRIEYLGDLPDSNWAVTAETWATIAHKPVILIDGVVRRFDDMMALATKETIVEIHRLGPAAAMRLSRDSAAANGAIVVTTKAHAGGGGPRR